MRLPVPGSSTRCEEGRRGAVTVWLVVTVLVLVSIVGLGMDGGRMFDKRRHAQATADAAALAGAAQLFQNNFTLLTLPPGKRKGWIRKLQSPSQSAFDIASANGFTNDGVNSIVTVNNPPTSGAFTGQSNYVEVIVQYNLSNTFGAVFTKNKMPVRARAVALGRQMPLGLLLLRPSGADAFLNNSPAFTLVNSRMYVDSTDASAFRQAKAGVVTADAYDIAGNFTNPGGAVIIGKMHTGTRQVGDPLRLLPAPDPATLLVQSNVPYTVKKKATLQPGIYRGGILLDLTDVVTMNPGIYYLEGGGLQVTGAAKLSGDGVIIYNTSGAYAAGPISVASTGIVALTAPTSGPYQGVSIFQDRSVNQPLSINGTGAVAVVGMVYAPAAPINLTGALGGSLDTLGGAYICYSMQVGGLGSVNIDLANNPPPMPEIALVE